MSVSRMGGAASDHATVHGSAALVGERGVLVRGVSGSGKSLLVHALVRAAEARGVFARLVADDRVDLCARGGRLVARPVPPLCGLVELRGLGIARVGFEPAVVVRLLVDLGAGPDDRLPVAADSRATLLGVELDRMTVPGPENVDLVLWRICDSDDTLMTVP